MPFPSRWNDRDLHGLQSKLKRSMLAAAKGNGNDAASSCLLSTNVRARLLQCLQMTVRTSCILQRYAHPQEIGMRILSPRPNQRKIKSKLSLSVVSWVVQLAYSHSYNWTQMRGEVWVKIVFECAGNVCSCSKQQSPSWRKEWFFAQRLAHRGPNILRSGSYSFILRFIRKLSLSDEVWRNETTLIFFKHNTYHNRSRFRFINCYREIWRSKPRALSSGSTGRERFPQIRLRTGSSYWNSMGGTVSGRLTPVKWKRWILSVSGKLKHAQ